MGAEMRGIADRVGRKKLWDERLTLPLAKETVERMDAALSDGEVRLDLIRAAIDAELRRRSKKRDSHASDPAFDDPKARRGSKG